MSAAKVPVPATCRARTRGSQRHQAFPLDCRPCHDTPVFKKEEEEERKRGGSCDCAAQCCSTQTEQGMETMRSVWICLMLVAAAGIGKGNGQAEDCTSQLAPVAPCLDYVQGTAASPSKDCCSGLSSMLTTSPVCLCQLSEGRLNFSSLGITVDLKRALSLPTACKIKGADRSRCAAILGSPAQAPHAAAAGPGPAMASGSETGTSAGGSAAAPNAAGMAAASPLAVLVSALVVVAGAVVTL